MSTEDHVRTTVMFPNQDFLVMHECTAPGVDIVHWTKTHRTALEQELLEHGAILLRNFATDRAVFACVADQISPRCIDYRGGNAPRTALADNIFTSSELPPPITLVQHHEMMFSQCWPMKLLFFCELPAQTGGETPLCSARHTTRAIAPTILHDFDAHGGIMYIRNFRPDIPFKTLEDTFGTSDRAAIEMLCRADSMDFEWKGPSWLQTRQIRPAFRVHPVTGDRVFVATPHLWHRAGWTRQLVRFGPQYSPEHLPADSTTLWMHALYGDGTPIDDCIIHELYDFYEREKVALPWQRGDILILDNIMVSHGRNPFTGPRCVLAALREPFHAETGFLAEVA